MEIEFSGKSFTLTVKLRPLTQKMNAGFVLPSNHFRAHKRTERERERERARSRPTLDVPSSSRRRDHRCRRSRSCSRPKAHR